MRNDPVTRLAARLKTRESWDDADRLEQVGRHGLDINVAGVMMPKLDGIGF